MAIGRPVSLTSNVASKTISVTATASQTLFTVTGGYRINELAVFRNGVRLVDSVDYTARDGSTVTLLSAATAGDSLEFQIFDDFRVADAINPYTSTQTISGELNVTGGINIGIQSSGVNVTTGVVTAINFTGAGNTFAYNSSTKTVDVSIRGGGGGGGLGTAINYADNITPSPFSYIEAYATVTENLNYSADGLKKIFPKYFPGNLNESYARKPEAIASRVYASRMGNGNEATKEGFKFRGRGFIQLTGKENYASFDKFVEDDILANPDLVATKYPLLSAAWFFHKNNLNAISAKGADDATVTAVTKRVNGGTIGLPDRIKHFKHFHSLLK
jgi:putative chitinase